MLVGFPIAFIYGAVGFDIAAHVADWMAGWTVGACLSVAAVVTGLAAGVPGLVDYIYVVPPRSSGKRRATWHMLVNVSALGVMALGWLFRDWDTFRPQLITVLFEGAAAGLVTWGGWMGGTLAYRNQIGVDHRYAQAGKWREQVIEGQPGTMVPIQGTDTLKTGQMMLVRIGGRRIVVAKTEKGLVAFDDHCTHRGGSLAGGTLACETVCCPWHGSQFSVNDGSVHAGPAEKPIAVFKIEHSQGQVTLQVPE